MDTLTTYKQRLAKTHMSSGTISDKFIPNQLSKLNVDGDTFALECYETINAIMALKDEWQSLEAACPEDFTYFQDYEWCIEYYKQFADDLTNKHCPIPQVFVLRKQQKPIMLWPLMRIQSRVGLKILTAATEPLGQYCNLLFDASSFNETIGKAALKLIIEHSKSDIVSLNNYPSNCLIDKIIGDQGIRENSNLESSVLDLTQYENWDTYLKTLSGSQRKTRKRTKNKLEAKGELTYKVHKAGTDDYANIILLALEMKKNWLIKTGRKPGILDDKCTKAMFENLKPSSSNHTDTNYSGPLVHTLSVNDKTIALEMGMQKAGRYYSYLGAIDWEWNNYSPGKVQIAMAQEWAMNEGIKYFDLLHDPSEYKSSWTNHTHSVISKNIPITFNGYVYSKLWKTYMRPKLKSLYHFAGTKNRDRLNKILDIIRK